MVVWNRSLQGDWRHERGVRGQRMDGGLFVCRTGGKSLGDERGQRGDDGAHRWDAGATAVRV